MRGEGVVGLERTPDRVRAETVVERVVEQRLGGIVELRLAQQRQRRAGE